ncbi:MULTISPECIES: hypothetical protein [Mesorhizobium]|uniref:hypothetical protein n=1 Tax=Mesorhizobium TaxID=68287 RepID=UPI00167C4036|nr:MULTISPECIES: hypothetical protein [Mesorhizobium]MCF6114866.1 hypothetical protein [Mesorhizobium muleiense]
MNQNPIFGGAYGKSGVAAGFMVEKIQQGQKMAEAGKEYPEKLASGEPCAWAIAEESRL